VLSLVEKKCNQAIDDAFSPEGVSAFLESLQVRGVKICNLEEASSDLTEYLPGATFSRGDTFDMSFLSLYQSLGKVEQSRVHDYYELRAQGVPATLKRKFAKVFRK
jgi:hypothetical protein